MTVYEAGSSTPLYPAVDQDSIELSSSSELCLWGVADLTIPFEFDKNCYIIQMSNPMQPLTSWSFDRVSSTNLRLGTESYVDSIDSQYGARVACRTEGGVLTCGSKLSSSFYRYHTFLHCGESPIESHTVSVSPMPMLC